MTLIEAVQALREGRLDDSFTIDGDPAATTAVAALASHLRRIVGETRRIMDEIAVQGRLGGQASVPGAQGEWSRLVVDVNYLSARVTEQIRDLTHTVVAGVHAQHRPATASAAGEIRDLMDAVNTFAALEQGEAEFAHEVSERADRIQATVERLASRVEERTDEVRRLLDARTQFFTAMSHELRTPLAVILRQAESLLEAPGADADADATAYSASIIHHSADELLAIVNDVLDLARAETGGLDLVLEDIDFRDLVLALEPTLRGIAQSGKVDFSIDVPRTPVRVRGDRRRLRQVVLNLVDNAVKYTPSGGRVWVTVREGTSIINLRVDDTGVGIHPEEQRRIFEPFYRVPGIDPQRGEPSTGLGLALTKRIVVAHNGQIYCISRPERGTHFVAMLPTSGPPT